MEDSGKGNNGSDFSLPLDNCGGGDNRLKTIFNDPNKQLDAAMTVIIGQESKLELIKNLVRGYDNRCKTSQLVTQIEMRLDK